MSFSVDARHPALPGHFPGRPVVPGVMLLERVLAAIESAQGPVATLRLPQVKFVRPLLPGEQARVELERVEPERWRFRVLRDDGALLASGEART